jgi:ABC-type transport system substrate-binding protein
LTCKVLKTEPDPSAPYGVKKMSKAITRVQAGIVIVVIVVAVAAGAYFATVPGPVAPEATTTTTATSSAAVPNTDTIIVEVGVQPQDLDPGLCSETTGLLAIENVYESLVYFNGNKSDAVVPWLAQSYDVSPDGLTYTFKLRSGITFTDGTPLDANAVWYSVMRALIIDDPDSSDWTMNQVIRGGQNYSKGYINAGPSAPQGYGPTYTQAEVDDLLNAKPVEVIDPMTVAMHLERPYAAWPFIIAMWSPIVSPTAFKAHWTAPTDGTGYTDGITAGDYHDERNPWLDRNMVGTGPYMLKSWDKASGTVILVRNEHYWGGPFNRGIAPVPNVIIKYILDPNTRVLDLKAGTSDILGLPYMMSLLMPGGLVFQFTDQNTWLSQNRLVSLSPDWQLYPTTGLWPEFQTNSIQYNQKIYGSDGKPQAFQPFSDVRIRKALTLLFNRTSFVHDILSGFGTPATQMIPPGMFGYDPSIPLTPYDPATAKTLLLDAGANPSSPGNAFSATNPKYIEISYDLGRPSDEAGATVWAAAINNLASDTGLYARTVGLAYTQWRAMRRAHQSYIFFTLWAMDYPDPDDFLVPFISTTAGYYATQVSYDNTEARKLTDEQSSMTDPAQRLAALRKVEQMVNDDWAFIWSFYASAYSISRSWIHERANPSVSSGIVTYNPALYGLYFAEMQKGSAMSSSAAVLPQPSFIQQMAMMLFAPVSVSIRKGPQTI